MDFSDEQFAALMSTFSLVSTTTITVLGVFGNAFSFSIFMSAKFRKHSTNRWLAVLAVSDFIQVCLAWPQTDSSLYAATPFNCKCVIYVVLHFYLLCSFLLAIAALDRMLSVAYPTRFAWRKQLRSQVAILAAATALIMAVNSPFLIYYDAVEQENVTMCQYNLPFVSIYFNILICTVALILPVGVMLACTVVISINLVAAKKRLGKVNSAKRDTHLTRSLFGMSIFSWS